MIDLHMHTFHSDGDLIPAELVRRAKAAGYKALAITDHVDQSNLEEYVPQIVATAKALSVGAAMMVLGGVEITHVPPRQIPGLIKAARDLGADLVVVHGETPVEPVARGTNRAGIMGGADIIAHPGLITRAEARLARQKGVVLEITSRAGHSLTNGYVAKTARQAGCGMVINSDCHAPWDLHTPMLMEKVVLGAGLSLADLKAMQTTAWKISRRAA
ncbi:histidinol phosphate phosphatase domain-containing protein [candidate division FCPU426 bacterium]|nr:histidinol phosphate phosphatase domain-containing protein [candidate division FCPU426 bacterium]